LPHVHSCVYHHFVWSTWNREPFLVGDVEEHAYALIRRQCKKLNCIIRALGGIEDHIHLLLSIPCTSSISDIMESLKRCSSRALNIAHNTETSWFGWQKGYGVHTVSPSDVQKIVRYIRNQRKHHQDGTVWSSAEKCGDE
jgi:putative transposase